MVGAAEVRVGGVTMSMTCAMTSPMWSGGTWSSTLWSGRMWSGDTWSGRMWSGNAWSSVQWGGDQDPLVPLSEITSP